MGHRNEPDHPLVRAGSKCVACGENNKPQGLLLHWHCHNEQKDRHDGCYSQSVDRALDALEAILGQLS